MSKIKVISDSSCDLSPELLQKYDIELIPFYINLGGRLYRDGIDIVPDDIYDYVAKTGILPGTVACSIEDFRQVFEKWRKEGYEIIYHSISSEMSCSCQNARIAAEEVGGVYVVDSRNLSTGEGHIVLNAAIMARSGMEAPRIAEELERLTAKVRASFILDSLDYMRKGGRCSSVALLGTNLLKIKPEIVVENGAMKVGRKFRGNLKKVLEDYVDMRLENSQNINTDRIFITHTKCDPELVEAVRARIEAHVHFKEVIETMAGSTVTSHCGQNTLGILYLEK